jgi:hypothetical protein
MTTVVTERACKLGIIAYSSSIESKFSFRSVTAIFEGDMLRAFRINGLGMLRLHLRATPSRKISGRREEE